MEDLLVNSRRNAVSVFVIIGREMNCLDACFNQKRKNIRQNKQKNFACRHTRLHSDEQSPKQPHRKHQHSLLKQKSLILNIFHTLPDWRGFNTVELEKFGKPPISRIVEEGNYDPQTRTVRVIKGSKLHCANWQIEGILRMLFNVLDVDVAREPKKLIVYGGTGKAARSWECFETIVNTLLTLKPNETLVIQSGKPVAVFTTHELAPRTVICNSMLVGRWANWEHFWQLERKGLTMYGQYTAGSWNYIGMQGILQGTYETFASVAEKHFGGTLKGRFALTAGMGAMGSAQPLAIKMNDGVGLIVEVDTKAIEGGIRREWLDTWTDKLEKAISMVQDAKERGEPLTIGLLGNAADVFPELLLKNVIPDVVTDQTPAHDPLSYVPSGLPVEEAAELRKKEPEKYVKMSMESMRRHTEIMVGFVKRGAVAFEYGNNIRKNAYDAGFEEAFAYPGFIQAYIRPMLEEGRGPFRWTTLQGSTEDIVKLDDVILREFDYNKTLVRWIEKARKHVKPQGLPARVCWLGYGERARFGKIVNDMVASGEIGPIWVGRDHLDTGSVASPYRETEGMKDGSDAVADWPILNSLLNTCAGATWVAVHQGGGMGMGYSVSAGFGMVLDGTKETGEKAVRLFTVDPGIGIVRHADAEYETSKSIIKEKGIKAPMIK
jgi:urocanate hydratase